MKNPQKTTQWCIKCTIYPTRVNLVKKLTKNWAKKHEHSFQKHPQEKAESKKIVKNAHQMY